MSSESNKEIVCRFINEYQTNKREEIADELIADDFFDHSALPGISPDKSGLKQLFNMLWNAFDGFRAEIYDQIAEGEKVTTRKTFFGTHTGEFMGIAATDRPIELGVIDILTIKNGQIAEHWCQVNLAGLIGQITGRYF
jgi:predicted ester cyclase